MTTSKPLFLVFGATGAQGGSVIEYLLKESSKWRVRGATRNTNSNPSKALQNKGVEMVQADQNKPDQVQAAFKGVHTVFAVTNFWDPESMGKEWELGKSLADIAKKEGVKHFIWSTLPDADKISKGKFHVPHFTDKARVLEYIEKIGLPASFIAVAFYYQNFKNFAPPKEVNGELVFTLPNVMATAVDVSEIGAAVAKIANNPEEFHGKVIALAGEHALFSEYIKTFTEVTGKKARLEEISLEKYGKLGFPGAEELAAMYGFFNEYTVFGPHWDRDSAKKIGIPLKSWREWLKISGWKGEL